MLHATLLLVAATAEKSKIPFYILGGGLAVWAVVLGLLGLTRPSFPAGGAEKGVIGLTFLLVAGAMATAVLTA
jgi:hypothetical protein